MIQKGDVLEVEYELFNIHIHSLKISATRLCGIFQRVFVAISFGDRYISWLYGDRRRIIEFCTRLLCSCYW
nr:hypothetical protein [Tanacetum cinerariifolium]